MASGEILMKPTAKTAKGKRILDSREPQVIEPPKSAVFVKSTSSSQLVNDVLHSLYALKKPLGHVLSKKNDIRPFEFGKNLQAIEFLMEKNEASLMLLASHSKKR